MARSMLPIYLAVAAANLETSTGHCVLYLLVRLFAV